MPLSWCGDPAVILPAVAEVGYEGVELQVRDPDAFDHDAFQRRLRQCGLEVPVVSTGPVGIEDGLYLIHAEAAVRERAAERLCKIVDLAAEWGVQMAMGRVRGMLGWAPSRDEG